MKFNIIITDTESGVPTFEAYAEGKEERTLGFSVFILLRMVMDLLNTPHRSNLVDMIGTLHKAHREGTVESTQMDTGASKCLH